MQVLNGPSQRRSSAGRAIFHSEGIYDGFLHMQQIPSVFSANRGNLGAWHDHFALNFQALSTM